MLYYVDRLECDSFLIPIHLLTKLCVCVQVVAQQETDRSKTERPAMFGSPRKSPNKSPRQRRDSEKKTSLTMRLATTASHVLTLVHTHS